MRTQFTRAVDLILMVAAVVAISSCTIYLFNKNMPEKPRPMIVHTPVFAAGDCFVRTGVRESWELDADGRVMLKGTSKYLLMDSSEAERVSGGSKLGYQEEIEMFDLNHRKVLCPLHWKKHTHAKGTP